MKQGVFNPSRNIMENNKNNLVRINNISGYKKCPQWLRAKYREAVFFRCQGCNKHEVEVGILQPHRIKRKYEGGLYTVCPLDHIENNINVLCSQCHKKRHEGEPKRK